MSLVGHFVFEESWESSKLVQNTKADLFVPPKVSSKASDIRGSTARQGMVSNRPPTEG